MGEYNIGAGGWAYFQLPGASPLAAYSKAFDFVEVNSTFYQLPQLSEVQRWRRIVPQNFHFSVRANRSLTHRPQFKMTKEFYDTFERMQQICMALNADVLHLQFPASLNLVQLATELEGMLGTIQLGKLRLALEFREEGGQQLPHHLARAMQDHHILHCVDLLRGEVPAYRSDILYTRLFGKGEHNIYQPDDSELLAVDRASRGYEQVFHTFHGAKMYKDAARLKTYRKTGNFPMVTRTTGLGSLESVLREDSIFPSTKETLMKDQGWKLFDMEESKRMRAEKILSKLPEKCYSNLNEVMEELYHMSGDALG